MRAFHAVALLALCLGVAPAANAQVGAFNQIVTIEKLASDTTFIGAGDSVNMTAVFVRECSSQAQVLPAGTLQVTIEVRSAFLTASGPTSLPLAQVVCAQQPREEVQATYQVSASNRAPANGTGIDQVVVVHAHADASNAVTPPSGDASSSAAFGISPLAGSKSVGMGQSSKASPDAGGFLVGGLLGIAALVGRRR
jgi:hypothetical protein